MDWYNDNQELIRGGEVGKIGNYYFRNLRFYNIYFFYVYKKSFLQPYGDIDQVFKNFEIENFHS